MYMYINKTVLSLMKFILRDMSVLCFQVLVLLYLAPFYRSESSTKSYVGRDFVFAIVPSFSAKYHRELIVYIDIGSKNNGTLTLHVPYLKLVNRVYTLHSKGHLRLRIDHSIIGYDTFKENRGIRIQSDVDVSVLVTMIGIHRNAKAYIVYPIPLLGTNYSVLSYETSAFYSDYHSYIDVVGVENNTHIVVIQKTSVSNITLNAMEIYQVNMRRGDDPTGTIIRSDKPVSVLTGTAVSRLYNRHDNSLLAAQLLPVETWNHEFVVAPAKPLNSLTVRYLSNTTSTSMNVTAVNSNSLETALSSDGKEYHIGPRASVINSSENIEIMQYNGQFMTLVPPISNYLNEYSFIIPSLNRKGVHVVQSLSAIVNTSNKKGLLIDGQPFLGSEELIEYEEYYYTIISRDVDVGYHLVTHTDPTVTFGLLASGNNSDFTYAYGFYVGSGIQGKPTVSPTMNMSLFSSFCFSCNDTDQLGICDVVSRCGQSEVCYVQRKKIGSIDIYRTGCMAHNTCDAKMREIGDNKDTCLECCAGDFCNNKGCGDTGLPQPPLRGPECFQCGHISSPELCPTLTLCGVDEICSIDEYKWGDIPRYKLGCSPKQDEKKLWPTSIETGPSALLKKKRRS